MSAATGAQGNRGGEDGQASAGALAEPLRQRGAVVSSGAAATAARRERLVRRAPQALARPRVRQQYEALRRRLRRDR